jgi:hypothetical protein
VRQLVVFPSRPVSRLRYTQLGVLARPLTRTSPRVGSRVLVSRRSGRRLQGKVHGRYIQMQSMTSEEAHLEDVETTNRNRALSFSLSSERT